MEPVEARDLLKPENTYGLSMPYDELRIFSLYKLNI